MRIDIRPNIKAIMAMNAATDATTADVVDPIEGGSVRELPTTMTELADYLKVPRTALSRYLGGQPNACKMDLFRVALALGVSVDRLIWLSRR